MKIKIRFILSCAILFFMGSFTCESVANSYYFRNKTNLSFSMNLEHPQRQIDIEPGATKMVTIDTSARPSPFDPSYIQRPIAMLGRRQRSGRGMNPINASLLRRGINHRATTTFINTILNSPDNTMFDITQSGDAIILTPVKQ